jgi:hypothetical protein
LIGWLVVEKREAGGGLVVVSSRGERRVRVRVLCRKWKEGCEEVEWSRRRSLFEGEGERRRGMRKGVEVTVGRRAEQEAEGLLRLVD